MRLFVAIPLVEQASRELAAVVGRLRASEGSGGALRWSAPESWHITLQFLGNANAEQLECLKARLGEMLAAPVPVKLGRLSCFDRVGVLFAGVIVTPELIALQTSVVTATRQCGFAAEARPFHPHITLARKAGSKRARERRSSKSREQGNREARDQIRSPVTSDTGITGATRMRDLIARTRSELEFTEFAASEFVLYESHLGAGPARYEALARMPLGGTPDIVPGING